VVQGTNLIVCEARPEIWDWELRTFPVVSPQFRTFSTNFFVNEAHNNDFQLLAGMGLLGFSTLVWYMIILYRQVTAQAGEVDHGCEQRSNFVLHARCSRNSRP
jgi:hypothetical protein